MPSMPDHWRGYTTATRLIRKECCNFRPNKYRGPLYCCTHNQDCRVLRAERRRRCQWFERCLLPIAPASAGGDYQRLTMPTTPRKGGKKRRRRANSTQGTTSTG